MQSVDLTVEQIQLIQQDVKEAGVSFSHLEADLVDHICCYVEELMEYGLSFEKAYSKARKRINIEQLKDIEIKTILLINQKFKTMKTLMKVTGISGISLFLVSLIFKAGHMEGANVLLLLAIICLAFAYIPALFLTVRKERLIKNNIHIFHLALVAVFLFLMSFVFTLMHWPFKSYIILIAWISSIVFILFLFLSALKNQENRIINLSVVLILTIIVGLNIFRYSVLSTTPQNELRILEHNIEESNAYFEKQLIVVKNALDQTVYTTEFGDQYDNLINESDHILNTMETFKDKIFIDRAELRKYNKRFLKSYVKDEIIQKDAEELQELIHVYQLFILDIADQFEHIELEKYIRKSLVFDHFDFNQNAVVVYNNISRLQRDIRIIDREILTEILSQSVN